MSLYLVAALAFLAGWLACACCAPRKRPHRNRYLEP